MKSYIFTLAIAATAFAGMAHAQSINVSIIGKIVPATCVPSLSGGGVVNYNQIPAATLNATSFTVLESKSLALTISCDSPVALAISAIDNAAGSRVPGITKAIGWQYTDAYNFGLGTVSGANVGGVIIGLSSVTVDGTVHGRIASHNDGATWAWDGGGFVVDGTVLTSWGTTTPIVGTTIAGNMFIQAVLNKAADLPLTADVPLAGSATLTLVYL